jgi:hypothetical protein
MKEKWDIKSGTVGAGGRTMTPGSMAYWSRKKEVWEELMKKADSIFKFSSPAYQSPL